MNEKVNAPVSIEAFRERRQKLKVLLLEESGGRPFAAIFFSGEEHGLDRFEPARNFHYLTGVETPGAALLIVSGADRVTETLFLPAPDPAKERWSGKALSSGWLTPSAEPDEERQRAMTTTGQTTVASFHQLEPSLARPLKAARSLYLDLPDDGLQAPLGPAQEFAARVRLRYPALEIRGAGRLVGSLRRVKGPEEVALMRESIDITADAHLAIARHLEPGLHEYEIQAIAEFVFTSAGAQALAFPSIVGSGLNSCFLHYQKNSRRMRRGELVVCDIGCRKDLYCADLTRTFPVSGRFTKRQARIYDTVLEAQAEALSTVRPGAFLRDVHQAAVRVFERNKLARYYIHGTSHYLGLEAHDAGSVEEALAPGIVITVEPGIYIQEDALGVRIEDDVLVTEEGAEVLSSSLPRERQEIEKLLAVRRKRIIV